MIRFSSLLSVFSLFLRWTRPINNEIDRESGAGAATEDEGEEEEKLFGKFFERKTEGERERKTELGIFDYGEGLMIIFLSFPSRRL